MTESNIFEIDQYNLDKEWIRQPSLYHQYAVELADARRDWEEAKRARDVARAEADMAIRRNPESFGLVKITEKAIEATIPTVAAVRVAEDNVIECRHAVDILSAASDALEHRKRALEGLVSLFLADYFSSPRPPKGAEEKMSQAEKKSARKKGVRR